jgi:hypothetical protein
MDWENLIEDDFLACIDGIKQINPIEAPNEWDLYWKILAFYKTYRERKAKASYYCRAGLVQPEKESAETE